MLFRLKLLFICVFCSVLNLGAQNSLLWEISGSGLPSSSYVYGTFHLPLKALFTVNEKLDSVKNVANTACFELIASPDSNKVLQKHMLAQDGERVQDYFSGDTLATIYKSIPLPENMVNALKPIAAITYTMTTFIEQDVNQSMDTEFQQEFKNQNKSIYALEYYGEQINALNVFTEDEIKKELIDLVYHKDSVLSNLTLMLNAYKTQNISVLDSVTRADLSPAALQTLIVDRNRRMVTRMESKMKLDNTIVFIGAAHLGGQYGVLKLLKDKGYVLRPIK